MNADRWYVAVLATFGNVAFYGREEGDRVIARKLTHIVQCPDGAIGLARWSFMNLRDQWLEENAIALNKWAIIGMQPATEIAAKDFASKWEDKPGIILANGHADVKKAEDDAKRFKLM